MKNSDKNKFCEIMTILGETFQREISKPLLKIYFDSFYDLSIEQVELAFNRAMLTLKFFPKPAEIRELAILSTNKLLPDEAWAEVLEQKRITCGNRNQPKYSNPIIKTVVKSIGGLDTIWHAGTDQESYYRHNFIVAYKALESRDEKALLEGAPTQAEAKQILNKINKKITHG